MTCCMPENGAVSCNRILNGWCDRIVRCCTAAGAGACIEWAYSMSECRGHFVAEGLDCASADWASMTYCREGVDVCIGDIPLVACSDLYGGTASLPRSCGG
jgi:hypothetical protein